MSHFDRIEDLFEPMNDEPAEPPTSVVRQSTRTASTRSTRPCRTS
jgi:hypothetical protein